MIRRPPRSTRTDTLFPYTTLFKAWMDRLLALDTKGDPALARAQELLRAWDWNLDGRGKGDALALMLLRPANGRHYHRRAAPDPRAVLTRSEERRAGKGCVSTCRVRGQAYH